MKYIGLDCHKQYDHETIIDTETGEIKSKKIDSQILARLLMADLIPQAHLRKRDNRVKSE